MPTRSWEELPNPPPRPRADLDEIIGWDIANWSRALEFWGNAAALQGRSGCCLELGCGSTSNLTLWLAALGHRVVCSDFGGVPQRIQEAHRRNGVDDRVSYADVDARTIPYRDHFDVIVFKSVLGAIVGDGSLAIARDVMAGIHAALKPGGVLLFAENLTSTRVHQLGRTLFGAGKHGWRYFSEAELEQTLQPFASHELTTFGFLGCFGQSETQRRLLAKLDRSVLDRMVPASWHYVAAVIARK